MHGSYSFNGFGFHDDSGGHNHVNAISAIEFESFVEDWEGLLQGEGQVAEGEFVGEALGVGGFEEAGADGSVYFDRGTYDGFGDFVDFHFMSLSFGELGM